MRTAQTSLEKARRDAKTWHKLLAIHQDGDDTVVTVVRGLCLGHEPSVLADELRFVSSPELTSFLAAPEIQQKLFRPSQRGIVLVDVAGYSKFDTRGQSGILTILYEGLQLAKFSSELCSRGPSIDQIVPTGDGCFIIFKPASSDRLLQSVFSIQSSFYCHQKGLLRMRGKQHLNVLGIRLACHVGDVDFIIDSAGSRNAYGTGLNEAARILQYGPPALEKNSAAKQPPGSLFSARNWIRKPDRLLIFLTGGRRAPGRSNSSTWAGSGANTTWNWNSGASPIFPTTSAFLSMRPPDWLKLANLSVIPRHHGNPAFTRLQRAKLAGFRAFHRFSRRRSASKVNGARRQSRLLLAAKIRSPVPPPSPGVANIHGAK
jgi:hypothetical protein